MHFTFEQIAIIGIALYVLNRYLDYKVESWMEYYLHRKQEALPRTDHFSPLSSSEREEHAAMNHRFYRNGVEETRDLSSYLPRGPYTQDLEPLYNTTVSTGEGMTSQMDPLQDPLQAWQSTLSMAPVVQTQANILPLEPERAVCIGQTFQPISSPDGSYTTSLRPIEDNKPMEIGNVSGNIRPLGADHYPSGMSGGLHETSLLSNEQMVSRSRKRDGEIYRYMQELDDPYGVNPAEALTPFTKQWTA